MQIFLLFMLILNIYNVIIIHKNVFEVSNMIIAAQAVGIIAVVVFLLSYQQKSRKGIIILNAASRILYIVQYIMLGAFAGAVLDVLGTLSSFLAQNKDKGFVGKHKKVCFIAVNLLMIAAGLATYKNFFTLFSIAGVLLHTIAFWINDEKTIRRISFIGSPCWLVYNVTSKAYGSAVGDILSMVSILVAMLRYDVKKQK